MAEHISKGYSKGYRLTAQRLGDEDFSFIDGTGQAKAVAPVYQICFKSRATHWQYFNKNTGVAISSESGPLPLTYFGNAGTRQKPSGPVKAQTDASRLTRPISEVFI